MADWRADIERALTGIPVRVRPNEPLSRHTTFGIGGPARVWLELESEAALAAALSFCRKRGKQWWMLGRGSNVLISDQGLDGVVLRLVGEFERIALVPPGTPRQDAEKASSGGPGGSGLIEAGAGAALDDIADEAEKAGLAGFEFLAGIPGTLGGGLRTNAGAFGRSLGELVEELRLMKPDGSTRVLCGAELERGYRRPVYATGEVALCARLRDPGLAASSPPALSGTDIRRRRWGKQPPGLSAGSFFRNPPGEIAGRLVERCGLKGRRVGAAEVSGKHANFIMNTGNARFADVYELAQVVKANVEAQTGIVLEEEVQVLPDGSQTA